MRRLVKSDWRTAPDVHDAIQSYLVDLPESYYLPANRQFIWYLDRDLGLILFQEDFSEMDDEAISEFIIGALELLKE